MIALELLPQENQETAFRRRLDDLLKSPQSRLVHFRVAEGMYVLGINCYRYKGMVIRLNDAKDPRVIVSIN